MTYAADRHAPPRAAANSRMSCIVYAFPMAPF